MLSKLYNFWQIIRSSLWFTPALICILCFLGIIAVLALERQTNWNTKEWVLFFQGDVNDAKAVIGLLLSAMITMTTLAVSITVVVLSLAASQLGPRLIRSFMADRQTQIYIGIFFGTVTICFVLTGILHDSSLASPAPRVTISTVFAACFANLFVLLAFVNHVARSSIADHVVERVGRELFAAIDRLADPNTLASHDQAPKDLTGFPEDFETQVKNLAFPQHGYVQNIDYKLLLNIATRKDLYVRIDFKAGYYIMPGEQGLYVYPEKNLTQEIEHKLLGAFIIGKGRTPTQDIEYSMRHLTEIALRALSPGINDSFTAVAVINRLSAALAHLFAKHVPEYSLRDEDGRLRVTGTSLTATEAIIDAFSPIRQSGQANPVVLDHLLKKIGILLQLANTEQQQKGLAAELDLIRQDILMNFPDNTEGKALFAQYEKTVSILNKRRQA